MHTGALGIYSILIGHLLLHREESGLWPFVLWPFVMYAFATALHFATHDLGLRQDHNDRYDRIGPSIIGVVILNAPKEKLPEEWQTASCLSPSAGRLARICSS